jgi:hypothetical protein
MEIVIEVEVRIEMEIEVEIEIEIGRYVVTSLLSFSVIAGFFVTFSSYCM